MNLVDVLKQLQEKNISISLDGDQLKVNAAKGAMTKELMQLLKQHKDALLVWAKEQQLKVNAAKPIPLRDNDKPLSLSFSQQRLWFVEQLAPGNATYNVPAAIILKGELKTDILQQVLNTLIQRHEALRTAFIEHDGEAEQVVHDTITVSLDIENSPLALADKEALLSLAAAELLSPFDLSQAPLFRVRVLKLQAANEGIQEHLLLLNLHHIITDGWSNGILLQEIAQCYAAISQQQAIDLPNIPVQYADYAQWQQTQLSAEKLQEKTQWWQSQLQDVAVLELPTDHARPAQKSGRGEVLQFKAGLEIKNAFDQLSKQQGCTPFIALLSAYQILLHRLTGQKDICIGTPTANRQRPEIQNTLGFFVNTLALRARLTDNINFNELMKHSNQIFMDANEHQDVPFESIVDSLSLSREMSSTPIFQTMISYQKDQLQKSFELDHLCIEALEVDTHTAKFDLTFGISETEQGFDFSFEYDSDIFTATSIQRFSDYFLQLLNSIIQQPEKSIYSLDILSAEQQQALIHQGQGPITDYPKNINLAKQVEQWADKTPQAIAIEFSDDKISYQQLNQRASQYAHILAASGFSKGDILALTLQRSPEMLIAIVATLKIGGIYLPIDPNYPDDRISYMLDDSQAKRIICADSQQARLSSLLENSALFDNLISIEAFEKDVASAANEWKTTANNNQGQDAAYLMYTSGSTGQPKGVLIPQSGVSRLAVNTNMCITTNTSRIAHLSNVAFDAAALEIWTAFLNGACLVGIAQDDLLDSQSFAAVVEDKDISFLLLTVALFNVFVSDNPSIFKGVDYVFAGGEAVDLHKINAVINAEDEQGLSTAPAHLINAYGPTENSCISSFYEISETQHKNIPIGSAISNSACYILDSTGQLCPTGIAGELCTAGDGLALSYLNKAEQTAAAFIENPFNSKQRLYKTGDICRWNNDGQIEILGRVDEQVKLRGYRIELDEISRHLGLIDGVKEAAVIVKDSANKYLAAYIVSDLHPKNEEDSLQFIQHIKTTLLAQLPHYMVPQAYELLNALPINANGKLNKKALPEPRFSLISENEYIAARNPFEQAISDIWCDVLAQDKISVLDNFFEIGGHSLLATRVIAQIRKRFSIEIHLRELFDNPSIAELALRAQMLQGSQQNMPKLIRIADDQRPEKIPLSYAQQRLWFIDQLTPNSSVYNMPFALKLQGDVNVEALQLAFQQLVQRHETLRTRIVSEKGQAWQVIEDVPNDICHSYVINDDEQELLNRANEFLLKPFDIANETLLRAELLQQQQTGEYVLLVSMHHIISDGWSMDIFVRDLLSFYQTNCLAASSPLKDLAVQYSDYVIWQQQYLNDDVLGQQIDYWKDQLSFTEVLELPIDYPRPALLDDKGAQHHFKLPLELSQKLRALSQQQGSSLFMTLLASFQILLAKYSNQTDIAVGSPIANRPVSELEDMIGLFLNTLVLRNEVDDEHSFSDFLTTVKNSTLDAYQHQDVPFELLVDELNVPRDTSQTPLFQAMFILQTSSQADSNILNRDEINGIKISALSDDKQEQSAKFDITLNIIDTEEQLSAAIEYRSSLFSDDTIARMAEHLQRLLSCVVADPEQKIANINFITEAEIQQQLDFSNGFNATQHDYPACQALHHLIEKQALETPDATAIIYAGKTLSYQSLNEQANQLAHHLIHQGVKVGEPVGLCLYRSEKMSVALLAILKAGAAYVPFDPDFPIDRLNFMAEDTGIKLLISDNDILVAMDINVAQTLIMSEHEQSQQQPIDNIAIDFDQHALFNIIYTSGSTGTPKGVMVPHQGIINRLRWMQSSYPIDEHDTVLQKTPYSFDVSVWELFWPLMQGSTLVFAEKDGHKDARYLSTLIQKHAVTTLHFVPSMLGLFLQTTGIKDCSSLKQVFCSGEALQLEHGRSFYQHFPQAQLHNLYGPTEASIDVSFYPCIADETRRSIPIGKAIHNTQLHILDKSLNIVPMGVAGELYIGGIGLALGYLNRHELNNNTFIDNPFVESHGHPSEKLYKSGDVARYLSDGNIEYLGRTDHQIKVRGLRIELGEIESRLQQLNNIRESIVVAKSLDGDNSNMQLIAYCLYQNSSDDINADDIKAALKKDLPDYMLPNYFVALESWPLSANGKINRKALPEPKWHKSQHEFIAASTELEKTLAQLWVDLLPIDNAGIQDNFFEVGGHSLLATRLTAEIANSFDIDITVADIFSYPTIEALAQFIENTDLHSKALPAITAASNQEANDSKIPLSFNQQRLWFIYKMQPTAASYNMPTALKLQGHIDLSAFNQAVAAVFKRHDILRTVIREEGEVAYQHCLAEMLPAPIVMENIAAETLDNIMAEEAKTPFDLTTAPLIRLRLLSTQAESHESILLVTMHHIISDAVSLQNMVKELAIAYYCFKEGKPLALAPLSIQYADFALWQNQVLSGEHLEQQLNYWKKQLDQAPVLLNLPTDKVRPAQQSHNGAIFNAQLSEDTVKRVRSFSQQQHYTPFMVLLAAQQLLLARLAGDEDICIGVPIAGRHHKGCEDLIGFFVNALIIRNRFDHNPNVADFFQQVKQQVLAGFAHQDAPFEQVIEQCQVKRSAAFNPIAQVGFNYITADNNIIDNLADELAGITIESLDAQVTDAKYDMIWAFQDTLKQADNAQGSIQATIEFNTDLFELSTVKKWFGLYEQLINNMLNELQAPVLKIALTDDAHILACIKDKHREPESIIEVRPLTAMQRDLYLDTVLTPDNRRNYFGWIHRIQHQLDHEKFQQAIDIITAQYSSLRMRIVASDNAHLDLAYAAIIDAQHASAKIQVQQLDWSDQGLSRSDFNSRCKEELAFQPYDLANEAIIRFIAIKESDESYAIVLTAHHSCIDGISLQTVTSAYSHVYKALVNNSEYSLVDDNYAEYVHQQHYQCDNGESVAFWQQQAQGVEALTAAAKPAQKKSAKGNYVFEEFADTAEHFSAIKEYCENNNTTAFLYMKALYTLMLQSYCYADEDFYFTDIIAARPKGHLAETGCYFEQRPTVISAQALGAEACFSDVLDYLNQQRIKVRGETHISNSLQNRLFSQSNTQFMFNFYLTERYLPFLDGQSDTTFIVPEMEDAVTFTAIVDDDHLLFNFTYTDNVFANSHFVQRLLHLSAQVLAGTQQLSALQLHLPNEDNNNIVAATDIDYGQSSVIAMIEKQMNSAGNDIAIIDATTSLTYTQLNEQANQLAHYLQKTGIKPGDKIALCHSANSQFMVTLIATLKLGACYIPVDSQYPIKRIEYILQDSQARCVISESCLQDTLASINSDKIYLDTLAVELSTLDKTNLDNNVGLDDLLYLIYTSGSTGLPKAAAVKQRGEINLIEWYRQEFSLSSGDNILISSATGFDLTQKNLLAPLTAGCTIVFPDMDDYDPLILLEAVKKHNISLTNCAPSVLYPIVEAAADENNDYHSLASLRLVLLGGESIRISSLMDWLQSPASSCQLVNMYGPTECTDIASFYRIERPDDFINTAIPIGKANKNVQLHIADSSMRLLPQGFVGELLITGEGIGAGYLNNPALTEQSFIQHPTIGKAYRTGDLAQQLDDGNTIFINRIDHQVKLRGLRIELGEIETALKQLPTVIDSLVLVTENEENQKLCAYILTDNSEVPEHWRQTLSLHLSDYMIPQQLIALKQWPLTANGKIDRKALPAIDTDAISSAAYLAPRNDIETQLLTIWQEVLGQTTIGVHDDFFELGGHSLLAAKAVTRIREHFQQDLPLREVFLSPTIAAIAELLINGSGDNNAHSLLPLIETAEREAYQGRFPLSFTQQRLWLIEQIQKPSSMYNIPLALQLRGEINIEALTASIEALYQRHESLRTRIIEHKGLSYQQVSTQALEIDIVHADINKKSDTDANVIRFLQQPFTLLNSPLFKVQLIQHSTSDCILLINMHHIISDGMSSNILLQDLAALYQAHNRDDNTALSAQLSAELAVQYIDYSIWQQKHLSDQVLAQQIDYWATQLKQSPVLDLPLDHARSPEHSLQGRIVEFELPAQLSLRLLQIAKDESVTPFMLFISAFYLLLNRYSGQGDINIGTAVANRPQSSLENVIGFFVNTLVIRTDIDNNEALNFDQLLQQIKTSSSNAYAHQDLPFERLLDDLDINRDLSHSPLFQAFFTMQNAADISSQTLNLDDTVISAYESQASGNDQLTTEAKFELSLSMLDVNGQISGSFEYRSALFNSETISLLSEHFINLLSSIADNKAANIHEISFIGSEEKTQLLAQLEQSNTDIDSSQQANVQQLFETQVTQQPEAIAIVHGNEKISYQALNSRINKLAAYLQKDCAIESGSAIALCLSPGIDFIAALFAVLKTGCSYIPLDTQYPDERLGYIISHAQAAAILSDKTQLQRLSTINSSFEKICIDITVQSGEVFNQIQLKPSDNPRNIITPETALYNIYTSGSTGTPKGVTVKHQGESNLIDWYVKTFNFDANDKFLIISAIGFDLTQKNFFAPLCSGGAIVFPEDNLYDPEKIRLQIVAEKVTVLNCAPSALYPLIDNSNHYPATASLRCVLLGGEPIHKPTVTQWLEDTRYRCELVNMYGPTECTDISTIYRVQSAQDLNNNAIPIGQAISGTQTLILDNHQQLLPQGAVGELYICGISLSLGYINNAEENAKAFIDNPFAPGLMYKTGDLVRLNGDNQIEYIGRSDHQVKIRGLRIELGEIEKRLEAIDEIESALVVAVNSEENEKTLVAYYRNQPNHEISDAEIRPQLALQLAEYMLPSFYVVVAEWPLNANGKIDRKQLPAPQWKQSARSDIVQAKNAIERRCVSIWLEVLKLEEVSTHDNFFQIGGHSLKAAQVVAQLRQSFAIDISLRDMFDASTIIDLALLIEQKQQQETRIPAITKADRETALPLSYAQQRLWFLSQLDASSPAYNMPAAFRLKGELNTQALEKALNAIVQRHESLRTNFVNIEGEPQLIIHANREMRLAVESVNSESALQEKINQDASQSFSLESGTLLRAKLVKLSPEDHCLLLNMHHIISDGTSVQILIRELGSLYLSFVNGLGNTLSELDLHYTDYAHWQRQWLQGDVLEQQISFWRQQLSGAPTLLQLPLDRARPEVQSFNGAVYKTTLDSQLSAQLKQLSMDNGCTLFMTCLAAYQLLLSKYSQQKDICVGIPLAGRSLEGVDNIIGFFINALIIRTDFSANLSLSELLANIKNTTLAAFAHEHVPIEMLLNELDVERNLAFTPVAQCAFNMMSASDDVLPQGINDLLGDLDIQLMEADAVVSKFDLQMNLLDIQEKDGATLTLSMEYNRDIFDETTVAKMMSFYNDILQAFVTDSATRVENIQLGQLPVLQGYEKNLALTAMQRDIYLASLAQPETLENSLGYAWDAPIEINESLWEQTLIDISRLFDALRADLIHNDVPYQDIAYMAVKSISEHKIDFEKLDWSTESLSNEEIQQRLKDFVVKTYDLENDSGVSYKLIKIKEGHYWATTASHHLFLDGFAGAIHIALFAARYEQLIKGLESFPDKDAQALSAHFSDFFIEDHFENYTVESRQQFDSIETIEYWRNKLQQCEGLQLSFTVERNKLTHNERNDVSSEIGDVENDTEDQTRLLSQEIPVDHYLAVKKYCRQFAITPPLYFKSLYALLIQQYTRASHDFVLTEFNAGRNKTNKDSIGCFYHTQPFCFTAESLNNSIEGLFKYSKQHQKSGRKHLQISNLMLRQMLPASGVYFSYNYLMMPHHTVMLDQHFTGNRYTPNATGMVDLRVQADGNELCLWLAYNANIFDDKDFLQRLLNLSTQLLEGNIETTSQLQYTLADETSSLLQLSDYNAPALQTQLSNNSESNLWVHHAISLQAQKTPDAIAVLCGETSLSYRSLEQQSNALAHKLITDGLVKGDRLAIALDRSIDLIIALVASIKAGACYIPLDTAYPDERLQYIIADAEAKWIISDQHIQERLKQTTASFIDIEKLALETAGNTDLPAVDIEPDDSLYMIYTSGSTGQPKGAMVYHKGERNLLQWYCEEFNFNANDKTLIISATGFDLTQKNFYALLTVGGTIVLPSSNDFDVNAISETINKQKISLINCAPSAFYALIETATDLQAFSSLRQVFFGGEAIQINRLADWIQSDNYQANIINMYGPTECTDISTFYTVKPEEAKQLVLTPNHNDVPLGRANSGVKLYVLNDQLQQVPNGLAGELCIAGISVGAGYWKKPELTASTFIENPYAEDENDQILYRTGDLVKVVEHQGDAVLQYIGRSDYQVKLRGLRIELGEIEQQIKSLAQVEDAQVLVDSDQLLAFALTPEKSLEHWREILAQHLPDYMLPAQIVCLKQWPLTPNGKIDRKALLQLERQKNSSEVTFLAPRNDMEKDLATLWQEVLGLGKVGVHENFFESGGDSLSAVRLIARIELRFEVKLPVASLFGAQTIAQLAHVIHNKTSDWSPIVPIQPQGNNPPIFAVHALGAMVLSYEPLARTLGKDQPFYGIQAYGFEDDQTPFTDLDEMVSFYIEAIKQQQPQGPYQIMGHSFGGLIALEIARKLIADGDSVQFLGLIDTYKPVKYVNMPLDDAFILKTFAEHNFGVVDIPLKAMRVMKPETMIEKVAQRFNGIVSADFIRSAIEVIRGFQRMTMNYKAEPLNTAIQLYRPEDSLNGIRGKAKKIILRKNADNLGWHKITQELHVSKVKGDHHSLLKVENVASFASQLEQHLADINRDE